jgi:hypothetical protein
MRMRSILSGTLALTGALLILSGCNKAGQKKVYFGNLEDGTSLESPFKVQMKAENLIVEPASMGVTEGHGHFHILVDVPSAAPGAPIPKDGEHIHYGNGQTETVLDLPVGKHTLILEFAKGDHVPYDPPVLQQITVNVTKRNAVDSAAQAPATPAPQDSAASSKPGA